MAMFHEQMALKEPANSVKETVTKLSWDLRASNLAWGELTQAGKAVSVRYFNRVFFCWGSSGHLSFV